MADSGHRACAPRAETRSGRTRQLDAQDRARRRVALAQIRQYPDAVLRMRAREVEQFDDDLARLAERMAHADDDARGVGLAATQVGVLQRMFVFQLADDERRDDDRQPRDHERSRATRGRRRGLPLAPGRARAGRARARGHDRGPGRRREPVRLELEEIDARVVQHELDHLDGVLMLERTTTSRAGRRSRTLRPQLVLLRVAARIARRRHGALRRGRARAARRPARRRRRC